MKSKIIIIIISALIICLCIGIYQYNENTKKPEVTYKSKVLKDFDQFKNINSNDIESVKVIRYTEGGDNTTTKNGEEAKSVYESLSTIKLGKETNMTCEDNTTVYVFNMKDKTSFSIEIECDWIILDKKRYLIE